MKTRLNTNTFSRFDDKTFFVILLGFSRIWDYKSNQLFFSEKLININPLDNF